MPTYEYLCESCNNRVEIFHAISDNSEKKCNKCNKLLKKMPTAGIGIIVKGNSSGCSMADSCPSSSKACQADRHVGCGCH
ncbi:MAG: hypothetical protein ACD_79C00185G0001 [uncultured bacterium]|nr:MAG: hypothetical protein ACD_79C00185G0001 [uncultured bacterium]